MWFGGIPAGCIKMHMESMNKLSPNATIVFENCFDSGSLMGDILIWMEATQLMHKYQIVSFQIHQISTIHQQHFNIHQLLTIHLSHKMRFLDVIYSEF